MNDLRSIYTVKGKRIPVFWEFQYDLNGDLKAFNVLDGSEFSPKLQNWLLQPSRFPLKEEIIKSWTKFKNLEIIIGEPDLTFENFWKAYNLKVGKIASEKAWNRLTKLEKLKAIKSIKAYDAYLRRKGISKAYPQKYLNQKKFNDEFNSLH